MIATQAKSGTKQTVILLLALATSLVHLYLFISLGAHFISGDIMFFLNFLGYLGLLAAYSLPIPLAQRYHGLVRWVLMGFAALTIVAWIILGDKSWWLGWVTKLIEIVLIAVLWTDRSA